MSKSTVSRLWRANDLKPHRTRLFKISSDTAFEAKFWDVVGLYMNPPENGIVLCCDEKTQCQALERTQPALPLKSGRVKTFTHDYIRHGVLCLFAALDYATGRVDRRLRRQNQKALPRPRIPPFRRGGLLTSKTGQA